MAGNFEATMKKFLEDYEKQEEEVFFKEFMTLKSQSQKYKESNRYPVNAGQLAINRKKNRFKDILPFEYTRVELHPVEGVEGSDYINANYVLGSDGEINYIAAQGPLPNTVEDFWRMVWYHNIEVVVMACREVEMGKKKCERYWPLQVGEAMDIGAIKVTMTLEENVSNDFVIRDFTAECQGEKQVIRQYHYNAWPDHGKPDSPDPIIRMIELIDDYRKNTEVPVVVHCSAGCGRTGTLIGIDIAKRMLLSKDVPSDFSVFKIVEKMRQQRPAMVQAKDQYLFVHMAIAELARRSIGFNPTLPPKPANKPAPAPTGKAYMNLDTNAPGANSRSPTPSSNNTSPPLPTDLSESSDKPIYQNVQCQPPLPAHKRNSKTDSPEPTPVEPQTEPAAKVPPVAKRKPKPTPNPPSPPEKKHDAPPTQPGPPKPRPRKQPVKTDSNPSLPSSGTTLPMPVSPSHSVSPPTTSPAYRPATPTKSLPHLKNPEPTVRPKSPDMSRRPLPSTPDQISLSSSSSSLTKSPPKSASPLPEKPRGGVAPEATYDLAGPEAARKPVRTGIVDTLKDMLGEEVLDSIEKTSAPPSRPMPSIPAHLEDSLRDRTVSVDGAAPEIPQRTDARLELVEFEVVKTSSSHVSPTYEMPDTGASLGRGASAPSTYPNPPSVMVQDPDYEQPTPLSTPIAAVKSSSVGGVGLSPSAAPGVTRTPSLPIPHSSSPSSAKRSSKISSIFNKKSKKDNKKKAAATDDIDMGNGPNRHFSPSGTSATMPVTSKRLSPSVSTRNSDEKYKFPGNLGYGIRLKGPSGPREEPHHWKSVSLPNAIHVV